MEKVISSGVLIIHNKTILACLPYGRNSKNKNVFDLPKGKVDKGESFEEAALREVEEETGLVLEKNKLKFHGVFEYKQRKDLALFEYRIDSPVNISELKCRTTFFNENADKEVPEHIGYEIIPFSEIENKFFPNLVKVIKKVV